MTSLPRSTRLLAPVFLALALAGCSDSDVGPGPTSLGPDWQSEIYEDDAHWLCRRGQIGRAHV